MMKALAILSACAVFCAHAQVPTKIYAQELVDQVVARNSGVLVIVMLVTPPKAKDNMIIASNIGRLGRLAGEIEPSGERFEVKLALHDVAGENIGVLRLVFPYRRGDDEAALGKRAIALRDALARRILNTANLMDPFPFEVGATTKTHAQKLVDEAQARHPELLVLAMRAPPRGEKDIVVLGSTFGRHGKKADADDLKILTASQPATGVYSNGQRFGVDLPLRDTSGRTVGTMNVGYAYRQGDDIGALVKKAEALRDELARGIASADALDELDP